MALLIGFVLDQQVSVQKAFSGPLELQRRVGSIEAATIAAMDPDDLEAAFRAQPALHRFPADMARRTRALCAAIVETYGGDASRVWTEAADGPDLEARLLALPGIGAMKAKALLVILSRRFGLRLPGLEALLPDACHPRRRGLGGSAGGLPGTEAGCQAGPQGRRRGRCARPQRFARGDFTGLGAGCRLSLEVRLIAWSIPAAGEAGPVGAPGPSMGLRCCREPRMDHWG